MNVSDAISKLRIMLGAETDQVVEMEVTDVQLEEGKEDKEEIVVKAADLKLVDGTEVYTEGELATGSILYVKTEEGEEPLTAPAGVHETTDQVLITVGENGVIETVESKEVEAEEETEEEIKVEAEEETKEDETKMDEESLIEGIADLIKPYTEEIKELKEELYSLQSRFSAFADEPAAKKVRNNFKAEAATKKSLSENRLETLIAIRNKK